MTSVILTLNSLRSITYSVPTMIFYNKEEGDYWHFTRKLKFGTTRVLEVCDLQDGSEPNK